MWSYKGIEFNQRDVISMMIDGAIPMLIPISTAISISQYLIDVNEHETDGVSRRAKYAKKINDNHSQTDSIVNNRNMFAIDG